MTFFEHQARARRNTVGLVLLFALAVIGVTLAVNLVVLLLDRGIVGRFPFVVLDAGDNVALAHGRIPFRIYVYVTLATLVVIGTRSLIAMQRLRSGGDVVAVLAGGVPVEHGTPRPEEQRLLNVVDEMAIASGVTAPRVYVLRDEPGINAFAAGYAPNQAAIGVTQGALTRLDRDELQGVIAHEFSHILNGDMRLNVQMIGILAGILFVGEIGGALMRSVRTGRSGRHRRGSGVIVIGLVLTVVGFVGIFFGRLIKAAVSREREFLGDASAVQFTRNPDGLAGALGKIAAAPEGSLVRGRHAESLSHMFFATGIAMWGASLFAAHPPIDERIRRLSPRTRTVRAAGTRPPRTTRAGRQVEPASRLEPSSPGRARSASLSTPAPGSASGQPDGALPGLAGVMTSAAAVIDSVGEPAAAHVAYAAAVLDALPPVIEGAVASLEGAEALLFAFALDRDPAVRKSQIALLDAAGLENVARRTEQLAAHVQALAPAHRLPVVSLALPALRLLDQEARDRLVEVLGRLVDADEHVAIEEFVLLTIVRHHLAADAGRAPAIRYRSILEVVEPARRVISLLAHADGDDTARAAARGLGALQLAGEVIPSKELDFQHVADALAELRHLAPFVKRSVLAACLETVTTSGRITLAEAELVRAVAVTLDLPVPPILTATDPTPLAR